MPAGSKGSSGESNGYVEKMCHWSAVGSSSNVGGRVWGWNGSVLDTVERGGDRHSVCGRRADEAGDFSDSTTDSRHTLSDVTP